jgi:hypothetical protein
VRYAKRLVAAVAAAILVTDVAVVLSRTDDEHPVAGWDSRVAPLVSFVEKARGLRFKHVVPVSFLDDASFNKEVAPPPAETAKDKQDLAQFAGELRALGLLRGAVDLKAAYADLLSSSVIGLYVPDKQAVFVRGKQLTPAVRVTLAHELTHVLQDQYFDLTKMKDDAPGGDTTAVTALIEGDAVRIEEAYRDKLSAGDLTSYQDEQLKGFRQARDSTTHVPAVMRDFLGFSYVFGPVLLDSLTAKDGNAEVDRAFRHPPTSEAQVLDPVAYPYAKDPVAVPTPTLPAGAMKVDDSGPFGQVFLFEVLSSHAGYERALAAVQGWRGDSYVGYRRGTTGCVAADVRMADPAAARRLDTAAHGWATRVPGATVRTVGTTVSLRSCDPGSRGSALLRQTPSAFDVLVVRTQIVHELTRSGATYQVGRCVADAVLADGRRNGYRDLTSDTPSAAAIKRFQEVAATAVGDCGPSRG